MFALNISKNSNLFNSFGFITRNKQNEKDQTKLRIPNDPLKNKFHSTHKSKKFTNSKLEVNETPLIDKFNSLMSDKLNDCILTIYRDGKGSDILRIASELMVDSNLRIKYLANVKNEDPMKDTLINLNDYRSKSKKGLAKTVPKDDDDSKKILFAEQKDGLTRFVQICEMYNVRIIYTINHPDFDYLVPSAIRALMQYVPTHTVEVLTDGYVDFNWPIFSDAFYPLVRYTEQMRTNHIRLHRCVLINHEDIDDKLILVRHPELRQYVHCILSGKRFLLTFTHAVRGVFNEVRIGVSNLSNFKLGMTVKQCAQDLMIYGTCLTTTNKIPSSKYKLTKIEKTNRILTDYYAREAITNIVPTLELMSKTRKSSLTHAGKLYLDIGIVANKGSGKSSSAMILEKLFLNIPMIKNEGLTVGTLDSDAYNVYLKYGNNVDYSLKYINELLAKSKRGVFEDLAREVLDAFNVKTYNQYLRSESDMLSILIKNYSEYINTDAIPSLRNFIKRVASDSTRPDILFTQVHTPYEVPSLASTRNTWTLEPMWNLQSAIFEREMEGDNLVISQNDEVSNERLEQFLLMKMHAALTIETRATSYLSSICSEVFARFGSFL